MTLVQLALDQQYDQNVFALCGRFGVLTLAITKFAPRGDIVKESIR